MEDTKEGKISPSPPRKHNYLPWNPDYPHEWQEESEGCGAAANSMVYKALGHPVPQKDVYKAVVVSDSYGEVGCSDWLLYLDALARGFHVLYVRAINPIEMLKDCYEHSIEAIIHQRSGPNSIVGHATVLIGIDHKYVFVHCSANGPNLSFEHNEILERMAPMMLSDVCLGNSITLVSNPTTEKHTCKECNKEIPEFIHCPNCGNSIRLSPSKPLGCIDSECIGHKWIDILCPFCFGGIRRLEDRSEAGIPAEDWPQTLKKRQQEREDRKSRFKELFKSFGKPSNDQKPLQKD